MSHRRRLALLLLPIGAFIVLANVGSVLAPSWAHEHPARLLAFDSRNRHLLLTVGGGIAPAAFFLIGFGRLLITDPLFYLLGRWYGDTAIRWFERTTGGANGTAAWISRVFGKADDALVLIMPNNIVSLLGGHTRMNWRRFAVLDVVGTIGRLVLLWFLGRAFQKPLASVVDWLQRFQWPLIGAFAAIAIINGLRSARAAAPVVEELERIALEEDDQAEA